MTLSRVHVCIALVTLTPDKIVLSYLTPWGRAAGIDNNDAMNVEHAQFNNDKHIAYSTTNSN